MARKRYSPIGLNITDRAVFAIQFTISGGRAKVHHQVTVALEDGVDGAELSALKAIRADMTTNAFHRRDVIASVHNHSVDMRKITLSKDLLSGTPEFHEALVLEARPVLPYDPDHAVLDFLPISDHSEEPSEDNVYLLFASRKESINRQLAALSAAGFACLHIDAGPCAASRMFSSGETVLLVEIDAHHLQVSVSQGTELLFSRTLSHGFIREDEGAEQALSESATEVVDTAHENLVTEIKRSVEYFGHQRDAQPIDCGVLLGLPTPPEFVELLSKRLDFTIHEGTSFLTGSQLEVEPFDDALEFAVASGLALREYWS